jgi:hypothetical protein
MDYYFAHENLPADQKLPSSDLLSALHAYISKLYSRTPGPETEKAWKCMDETAIIALGVLLEETAKEMLGETGDLAFTEAADEEEERMLGMEEQEDDQEEARQSAEKRARGDEQRGRSDPSSSSDDDSQYTTDESD